VSHLYWTECNYCFWNFLLEHGFNHDIVIVNNEIEAIRFNLDGKYILGWASEKAEYNRIIYSKYKYISNKDLVKLVEKDA
jgi:hypothetical protein